MLGNTTGKHRYSGPVVVEKECGPARLPSNFSLQPFQAYLQEMGILSIFRWRTRPGRQSGRKQRKEERKSGWQVPA